jgi:hypothetical protein
LLRGMPDASAAVDPRSASCLQCHSPAPDETQPSASSGVLWQGRARVPGASGTDWDVVAAAGAHASVPGGCIGCHGATDSDRIDHSFRADASRCTRCHQDGVSLQAPAGQQTLQERARTLAQTLERACTVNASATTQPPHATPGRVMCKTPGLARALYEIELVREDPAAFVHNAALARSLLEDAERLAAQMPQAPR